MNHDFIENLFLGSLGLQVSFKDDGRSDKLHLFGHQWVISHGL